MTNLQPGDRVQWRAADGEEWESWASVVGSVTHPPTLADGGWVLASLVEAV